jgi:hypothetical protein
LKWPPALIPFSDPLDDLMNSTNTFLNAVDYVVSLELTNSAPNVIFDEPIQSSTPTRGTSRNTPKAKKVISDPIPDHNPMQSVSVNPVQEKSSYSAETVPLDVNLITIERLQSQNLLLAQQLQLLKVRL